MSIATRLNTDMAHWAPVTRHYQVDGGYLAVTVQRLLGATGTDIYLCDERAVAPTLEPIAHYPDGTTHNAALELLGYTVADTIGEEPAPIVEELVAAQEQSILDMLPAPIAAMIAAAQPATQENPA